MSNTSKSYKIRNTTYSTTREGNIYRDNESIDRHNENFPNDKKPLGNQVVSTEDVISTARLLNEFVNEKFIWGRKTPFA